MPDVQNPHWKAPFSRNGPLEADGVCRLGVVKPSLVVMACPETDAAFTIHDRTGLPSRRTVQAPHWPSPQPYLAPVSSSCSRNTLEQGRVSTRVDTAARTVDHEQDLRHILTLLRLGVLVVVLVVEDRAPHRAPMGPELQPGC